MVLKTRIKLLFILALCILLFPGVTLAQTPKLPLIFEGEVTIDGSDAPVGTVIAAEIDGVEAARTAINKEEEIGLYTLTVQNEDYTGKTVVFKVDGIVTGEHEYISSMELIVNFDLHAQTKAPADDIDDSSDVDNSISEKVFTYFSGLFGIGTKAVIGIIVGAGALIIVIVIVIIAVIRRRRYYI